MVVVVVLVVIVRVEVKIAVTVAISASCVFDWSLLLRLRAEYLTFGRFVALSLVFNFRFVGGDVWPAMIRKTMISAVHPEEDRYISIKYLQKIRY